MHIMKKPDINWISIYDGYVYYKWVIKITKIANI